MYSELSRVFADVQRQRALVPGFYEMDGARLLLAEEICQPSQCERMGHFLPRAALSRFIADGYSCCNIYADPYYRPNRAWANPGDSKDFLILTTRDPSYIPLGDGALDAGCSVASEAGKDEGAPRRSLCWSDPHGDAHG
mmetsp:Transcript_9440/g.21292  ORF Transcript_9440/g.21292 Transcript_9440/m.21292 type:complete len:139 (-) Transcript_9440:105-521(-)